MHVTVRVIFKQTDFFFAKVQPLIMTDVVSSFDVSSQICCTSQQLPFARHQETMRAKNRKCVASSEISLKKELITELEVP